MAAVRAISAVAMPEVQALACPSPIAARCYHIQMGTEMMRLMVRTAVQVAEAMCQSSVEVIGKGIPIPASFTRRERSVWRSDGMSVGAEPPMSLGRKTSQRARKVFSYAFQDVLKVIPLLLVGLLEANEDSLWRGTGDGDEAFDASDPPVCTWNLRGINRALARSTLLGLTTDMILVRSGRK